MEIKKLEALSKGTAASAYLGFKINPDDKQALTDYCAQNGLSVGKLLRNFISQYLAEVSK